MSTSSTASSATVSSSTARRIAHSICVRAESPADSTQNLSVSGSAFVPAASAVEKKNDYPIVLIHGLMGWGESDGLNDVVPYWGTLCGNVPEYLRGKGVEVYTASVGGQSSVWDQTCELYALLTGTRVDYGEAHAKEHGHARYGRTYKEPLYPEFGKKKVHLYGYSLGGTVARLLHRCLNTVIPKNLQRVIIPRLCSKAEKVIVFIQLQQ